MAGTVEVISDSEQRHRELDAGASKGNDRGHKAYFGHFEVSIEGQLME